MPACPTCNRQTRATDTTCIHCGSSLTLTPNTPQEPSTSPQNADALHWRVILLCVLALLVGMVWVI